MIEIEGKSVEELQDLKERGLIWLVDIPEYNIWSSMKARCFNPNDNYYQCYGGRGISVSKEWCNDFWIFFRDMGRRPKPWLTLERINNDGDYRLENVRWDTWKAQANNRRRDKFTRIPQEEIEKI